MLKVYAYSGCGTCRKALKFLEERGVAHRVIPIREQPPTPAELKRMLAAYHGDTRKLFNTSGQDYRALGLGAKLATLSPDDDFFKTLGIDSLQALGLLTRLENHFNVELPDYEVQGVSDFRTLAERIESRL